MRERNLGFEMDPRAVVVCTNLKQWKVMKKKSSERYIGSTPPGRLTASWAGDRARGGLLLGHMGTQPESPKAQPD